MIVALWQWRTLENTDQTLRLTLNLAHRPWVGITDIKFRNWPVQVEGKVRFDLAVWLKNVGKSPAVILVDAAAVLSTEPWIEPQRKRCSDRRAEAQKKGFGEQFSVIPDQLWPYHVSVLLDTPASEIQQRLGGAYIARIAGCVLYRSTFDDSIYVTSFVGTTSLEHPNRPLPRDDSNPIMLGPAPNDGTVLLIKAISMAGEPPR